MVPKVSSADVEQGSATNDLSAADPRWRQFTTPSALLIEIPFAVALIAAALLATLPILAWD
jgi:hypothetical protein